MWGCTCHTPHPHRPEDRRPRTVQKSCPKTVPDRSLQRQRILLNSSRYSVSPKTLQAVATVETPERFAGLLTSKRTWAVSDKGGTVPQDQNWSKMEKLKPEVGFTYLWLWVFPYFCLYEGRLYPRTEKLTISTKSNHSWSPKTKSDLIG